MKQSEDDSRDATGLHLNIAINYGGRDEILRAIRQFALDVRSGRKDPDELTEALFEEYLDSLGEDAYVMKKVL